MLGFLFRLPAIITAVVVTALVVGYFTLGRRVGPRSLGYSVSRVAKGYESTPCRRIGEDSWRCSANDSSGGLTRYAVHTDGHCWQARRTSSRGTFFLARLHGCVGLRDQIRLGDAL